MTAPRPASEVDFPYGWPGHVTYFTVVDGTLAQLRTRDDMRAALADAAPLYGVWPGEYRADLFHIDKPELLAAALGIAASPR